MTVKARNIVNIFPHLSLTELWVIIEAAQAQIRQQMLHPEAMEEQLLLQKLDRRYTEILSGKAALVSGEFFDAELEKKEE